MNRIAVAKELIAVAELISSAVVAGAPFSRGILPGHYDGVYIADSAGINKWEVINLLKRKGIDASWSAGGGRLVLVTRGRGQEAADILAGAGYDIVREKTASSVAEDRYEDALLAVMAEIGSAYGKVYHRDVVHGPVFYVDIDTGHGIARITVSAWAGGTSIGVSGKKAGMNTASNSSVFNRVYPRLGSLDLGELKKVLGHFVDGAWKSELPVAASLKSRRTS